MNMNISYMLRDPLDLVLLFIYVIGVLVVIFSAMQLLHAVLYKDASARRAGLQALVLGIVLLAPRPVYQYLRIDAADYKKSVSAAYQKLQNEGGAAVETDEDGLFALHKGTMETSDILIVSAPLYTADAELNASGLAVLTAVEAVLRDRTSEIELRFLVFSGENDGDRSARQYIDSRTEEERARLLGDLEIGNAGTGELHSFCAGTGSGRSNVLSDALLKSVKRMVGQSAVLKEDKSADPIAFHMEGLAASVLHETSGDDTAFGSSGAEADMDQLSEAAAIIGDALRTLMKEKSGSLREALEAQSGPQRSAGVLWPGQDPFPSAETVADIEQQLGTRLRDAGETDENGNRIYRCSLYLLKQDTPVQAELYVSELTGQAAYLKVQTEELGLSVSALCQTLENLFEKQEDLYYLDSAAGTMYHVEAAAPSSLIICAADRT